MDLSTILQLVGFAVSAEPKIAEALRNVLSKPDPTAADWQAEGDSWRADTYGNLVKHSQLTPDQLKPGTV